MSGTHRFARFRHDRLAYERIGPSDAPAVVLLHDLLLGRGMFASTRQALVESASPVQLVLPDARGHGASAAHSGRVYTPDDIVLEVEAVLAAAGVEQATLAGVGFGGAAAILTAIGRPERVRAVIAVAPDLPGVLAAHPDPGVRLRYQDLVQRLREIGDAAYQGRTDYALNAWLALRYGSDWEQHFSAEQMATIRRHVGALSNVLAAIEASTIPPTLLSQIPVPVTVAVPADASVLQREVASWLVATIPEAQLITFEEGPNPESETPPPASDRLARLILRSLAAEQ